MKNRVIVVTFLVIILVGLAGNTHRLLPAAEDPCQTDMSHIGHVNELSMFHCIGHTEYMVAPGKEDLLRVAKWDHLHPWMTLEWHIQKGFSETHARELITLSTNNND